MKSEALHPDPKRGVEFFYRV